MGPWLGDKGCEAVVLWSTGPLAWRRRVPLALSREALEPMRRWLELSGLQINHHEASKFQMIEQQIEVEILASDFQMNILTDVGESNAEFEHEIADMVDQSSL